MTTPSFCPSCGHPVASGSRFCTHCGGSLESPPAMVSEVLVEDEEAVSDQTILQRIRTEMDELKQIASAFSIEQIKDGSWFNQFIRAMLENYSSVITDGGGIEFFRKKYPGLTRDQIAEKLCKLAMRYAALAGGASGATASAAFAATIGTAGGAGIVTTSAGIGAIVTEMFYTTRLQVRLVYDLSIVYGYPIDVNDPEDLYRTFSLAYGVAFASGNLGAAAKAFTPEVARSYVRGIIHGHTQAIQQVAIRVIGPRLGRKITQRAILRTAVPGISIAISSSWNYVSTQSIARTARHELRSLGRLRDAVSDVAKALQTHPDNAPLVLESMLTIITADGTFHPHEQEVFNEVIRYLDIPPDLLETVENRVDISAGSVENRLNLVTDPDLRQTLSICMQLIAISDGEIATQEIVLLEKFLGALEQEFDADMLKEQAETFKRPEIWSDKASQSVSQAAGKVKDFASGMFGKAKAGFRKGKRSSVDKEPQAVETPVASDDVSDDDTDPAGDYILEQIRKLAMLHSDGILTDAEFHAKKEELLARL